MTKQEAKTTTTAELLKEELEIQDGGNVGIADASGGAPQEQDSPRAGPSARANLSLFGVGPNATDEAADGAQSAANLPPAAAASVVTTAFDNGPELSSPTLPMGAIGTMAGTGNAGAWHQPNNASRPSLTSRPEIVEGSNSRGVRSPSDFNSMWGTAGPSSAVARATREGDGGDNSTTPRRTGSAAMIGSIELGPDGHDEGPPPPVGMVEAMPDAVGTAVAYRPNQDDGPDILDDDAPHPPAGMLDGSLQYADTPKRTMASATMGKTGVARPNQGDDDNEPTPFDSAEFEDDCNDEKKPAARTNEENDNDTQDATQFEEDTVREPRVDEAEDRARITARGPIDITHRHDDNNLRLDIDGFRSSLTGATEPEGDTNPENSSVTSSPESDSMIHIPQAWAVSGSDDGNVETEGEVFIASPLEPLWKRREGKFFIAAIFALSIAGAIALGAAYSRNNSSPQAVAEVIAVALSSPPSESTAPTFSVLPTVSPSEEPSPTPSSSPTECAHQITSQVQVIDLQVKDLLERPRVAVDGKNMVAVVRDRESSAAYTVFYNLNNNQWIVTNTFPEEHDDHRFPTVALSGNTAFVGFQRANDWGGVVSVYKQNRFGDWVKVEAPFLHDVELSYALFGYSMDIDGDLACVGDSGEIGLFRRNSTKWVQFDRINAYQSSCSIAGDTIAIEGWILYGEYFLQLYMYDADLDGVVPLQEKIPASVAHMSMSNDFLAFLTWHDGVYVYHREQANHTFDLHQRINISSPLAYNLLALDKDMLVIGGDDRTHVFFERNGLWEETIALDRSYDEHRLSGRNLLVANGTGAYSFDFEGCAQSMPTQTPSAAPSFSPSASPSSSQSPSLSQSPSESTQPSQSAVPSGAPSLSASPSSSPTSSLSPTETCFFVEVHVLTDLAYWETWWDISSIAAVDGTREKIVYVSSTIELRVDGETYDAAHVRGSATDVSVEGALCDCGDGRSRCDCAGRVCMIDRRRNYFISTEVSNCEDGGGVAAIVYNNVETPLWSQGARQGSGSIPAAFISRADGQHLVEHGLGEVVTMTASALLQFRQDALHSRRVCLPEGEYEFTIYDHYGGDGICCDYGDGHYNVTSNGGLIAQGGEFGSEEVTRFTLPFEPVPDEGF